MGLTTDSSWLLGVLFFDGEGLLELRVVDAAQVGVLEVDFL